MADPNFLAPVTNPFGLTGNADAPDLADIDGDGDLDIFVSDFSTFGAIGYIENTGTASSPSFAPVVSNPFGLNPTFAADPTLADIDGDGDFDAFVGNKEGDTQYYENTGSATNPSFAALITNPFGLQAASSSDEYLTSPTFADIDNDGDLDAFIGNQSGNIKYYENTGSASSPNFATPVNNPFGLTNTAGFAANTAFADIDGDGDLDAFVGAEYGDITYFENTGSASSPG